MIELPQEIKDVSIDTSLPAPGHEVLEALMSSLQKAWEEAIRPRMPQIRASRTDATQMKVGQDFFTEADVESEKVIKNELERKFPGVFRFFGEELHDYDGNLDSPLTVRIDPIDGTKQFKFGQPGWGVMAGIYEGRDAAMKQLLSAVFYPEYYNEFVFRVGDVGVYKTSLDAGKVEKFEQVQSRDAFGDVLVRIHKSHDLTKRGNIDALYFAMEKQGARLVTGSPVDLKEALETRGSRIFVTQGDWDQVDFIFASALVLLGYELFLFDGTTKSIDDPSLEGSSFVLTPPGIAGEQVIEITRTFKL